MEHPIILAAGAYGPLPVGHVFFGLAALALGAAVFLRRKGTRAHVRLGWLYVAAIAGLDLSALAIYHLTGHFNLFHLMAVVGLLMVAAGLVPVLRRRRTNWLWRHYQYMSWSFVGLLAATANEACVRVPALVVLNARSGHWLPLVASGLVVSLAAVMIFANQRRLLGSFTDRASRSP